MKRTCLWCLISIAVSVVAVVSPVTAQDTAVEPETVRDFMNAGYGLLAEGQVVEAVEMLEEGVRRFPDEQALYYYLAGAHYAAGAPDAALAATLERTYRDGHREDLYFSEATGLMTEMVSEYPDGNPMMISAMSYWDYRDVGGIRIPHVFIRNVGELGTPHGGVVQEVRINEELGDDLFLPPGE